MSAEVTKKLDSFELSDENGDWLCSVENWSDGARFYADDHYYLFQAAGSVDYVEALYLYRIWNKGNDNGYQHGVRNGRAEIVGMVHELLGVNKLCETLNNCMEIAQRGGHP